MKEKEEKGNKRKKKVIRNLTGPRSAMIQIKNNKKNKEIQQTKISHDKQKLFHTIGIKK